jgi:hypothetical protein
MLKRFFYLIPVLFLAACADNYVTPIPSPDECNQAFSFKQTHKEATKMDSCVAINPNLGSKTKKIWGKTDAFWPQNSVITVKFIGGDTQQKNLAWKRFLVINSISNLQYTRVESGNANIRVAFDQNDGHWSYIGVYNKQIPQNQKTMNIALNGSEDDSEWDRVVIHETLHSAGFFHELQHPYYTVPWNTQKVLDYYRQTQGWSDAMIHAQVLDRDDPKNFKGTPFDPNSIMCYPVPKELTTNGFSVGWNIKLSPCDIAEIQNIYPPKSAQLKKVKSK